jgi:hypothetical protein
LNLHRIEQQQKQQQQQLHTQLHPARIRQARIFRVWKSTFMCKNLKKRSRVVAVVLPGV